MLLTCSSVLLFRYILTSVLSLLFLLVTSMTFDFCSLNVILFFFPVFNFAYFYVSKVFSFLDVFRPYCY
jgi:hypothetical protein